MVVGQKTAVKSKKRIFFEQIFFYLSVLALAVVLAVIMRVCFFASFKVPTPSMEPAILPGDYILVDKTVPGARIFRNFEFMENGGRPDLFRCPGRRPVRRNDVLVFNAPCRDWNKLELDMNTYYVKRCVAVPGDTFYIENGIYRVKSCTDTLGCYARQREVSAMKPDDFQEEVYRCYPYADGFGWNIQHFGPLRVPCKGDELQLDERNAVLYKKLIEYESGRILRVDGGRCFLGDSLVTSYTFQSNCYFMAGDFLFDSRDSRYWGLLPEDYIVGRAAIVWKSEDVHSGRLRWKRCLKKID